MQKPSVVKKNKLPNVINKNHSVSLPERTSQNLMVEVKSLVHKQVPVCPRDLALSMGTALHYFY